MKRADYLLTPILGALGIALFALSLVVMCLVIFPLILIPWIILGVISPPLAERWASWWADTVIDRVFNGLAFMGRVLGR